MALFLSAELLLTLMFTQPLDSSRQFLRSQFETTVGSLAQSIDGVVGVSVKALDTGESFSLNGDVIFTQASAIKLPVLIELLLQVEEGRYGLEELVFLESQDIVGGSGILKQLTPGKVRMTLRDLATLMTSVSDNTATNMIIDRVQMDRVNETMLQFGLTQTKLQRKMLDREAWTTDRENLSTPNEQMKLLEFIYNGKENLISLASRQEILRILSISKPGRIKHKLPSGTRVAHKTGSVPGVVVDVGIVYLDTSAFIITIMGNWLVSETHAAEVMSEIALKTYEYFDRLSNSNSYGHKK